MNRIARFTVTVAVAIVIGGIGIATASSAQAATDEGSNCYSEKYNSYVPCDNDSSSYQGNKIRIVVHEHASPYATPYYSQSDYEVQKANDEKQLWIGFSMLLLGLLIGSVAFNAYFYRQGRGVLNTVTEKLDDLSEDLENVLDEVDEISEKVGELAKPRKKWFGRQ